MRGAFQHVGDRLEVAEMAVHLLLDLRGIAELEGGKGGGVQFDARGVVLGCAASCRGSAQFLLEAEHHRLQ